MTDPMDRLTSALADRYRLERELGAGGMATVYLAQDLKHDRKVAIKVLKPDLAAVLGAERFVTEIKTTAALQHPHILPLFDSGTADGFLFYVMPFIQGETLRSKLDRETQLGVDEAIRIAREVADALHYAHQHGVIHRDIKPENILLHDGRPMVADFGIALAVSAAAGGRMTETGLSLGTPHYMSPEQATAEKEITARSDVYSLGSVLFEMLTGNPPHTGASAQQIIMKIVTEEAAPVTRLRRAVPPHVADAVAVALEKLPADRFASAKEFAEALADGGGPPRRRRSSMSPTASVARRRSPPTGLVATLAAALALTGALAVWGWLRSSPPPPVTRFIHAPEGEGRIPRPTSVAGRLVAVAPDGGRFVHVGSAPEGGTMLYLRHLGDEEARPLAGTAGARQPFFSPDGRHIGFFQGRQLRRLSLDGGGITTVADVRGYGAWAADDHIYLLRGGDLARVPAAGGAIEVVSVADTAQGVVYGSDPDVLPAGNGVLVTLFRDLVPELAVISLSDGGVVELGQAGFGARWLNGGYIAFAQSDGRLRAAPFDARRFRLTGPPVQITEGLFVWGGSSAAFDVARNGTLLFVPGDVGSGLPAYEIGLWDRDGRPLDVLVTGAMVGTPRFSPDGRRVAFSIHDFSDFLQGGGSTSVWSDVWLHDLVTGVRTRVTTDSTSDRPEWLADGRHVAYTSGSNLLRSPIDGGSPPDTLAILSREVFELQMDPGGRFALYSARDWSGVWRVPLGGEGEVAETRLTRGAARESNLALSPDGEWLAYRSNESGSTELYLRRLSEEGGRWRVPADGATEPRWSADGGELMYRQGEALLAVGVTFGEEPSFGQPRSLLTTRFDPYMGLPQWDRSPDGSRYVVNVPVTADQGTAWHLVIMLNWLDHLRRDGR